MHQDHSQCRIGYDLIGDVHGQADRLEALLVKMGYEPVAQGYSAPRGRKAVFLGDLIDRGPGQMRVLDIVMGMVERGDALCIMGNHEFNAIGYITPDRNRPGECLRPNRISSQKALKNRAQHRAFLEQVGEGSERHRHFVRWMRSLPVALDLGGLRVVHACWDDGALATLRHAGWVGGQGLSDDLLQEMHTRGTAVHAARELLTCGLEVPLPDGVFIGKEGHTFNSVRIANWRHAATSIRDIALVPPGEEHVLDGVDMDIAPLLSRIEGSPVFLGHHWFSGHPTIESPLLACLDWSAATPTGKLVAYRWDGEQELRNDKLVFVERIADVQEYA